MTTSGSHDFELLELCSSCKSNTSQKKKPKQLLASIWGDWEVIVVSGSSTGIRSINYTALTYKIKADPSSILLEQGD